MMKQRNKPRYEDFSKKNGKGSDSDEETELFVKSNTQRREIPSIEKNVEEGDTLQSLAIRYHCTIEDLKRLNNIHKDNEVFARITIKVPHRPFTMALASVHSSGNSSPNGNMVPNSNIDLQDLTTKIATDSNKDIEVNQIIFNSSILQKAHDHVEEAAVISDNEEICLLPKVESLPKSDSVAFRLSCNGADGDLSFIGLIVFIVMLIFAIPLICVFYVAEHPEKNHHQHHS